LYCIVLYCIVLYLLIFKAPFSVVQQRDSFSSGFNLHALWRYVQRWAL